MRGSAAARGWSAGGHCGIQTASFALAGERRHTNPESRAGEFNSQGWHSCAVTVSVPRQPSARVLAPPFGNRILFSSRGLPPSGNPAKAHMACRGEAGSRVLPSLTQPQRSHFPFFEGEQEKPRGRLAG